MEYLNTFVLKTKDKNDIQTRQSCELFGINTSQLENDSI